MRTNNIVTLTCSELKLLGRDSLKGQWAKGILGAIAYYLVTAFPVLALGTLSPEDGSPLEALFYTIFMTGPFTLGYYMFVIGVFRRDKEVTPSYVLAGWNRTFKSIGIYIFYSLIVTLGTVLLIVPGIIIALRYSQIFFIFADHPEWSIPQLMSESARMMKGNYGKYFKLCISFVGWIILACIVGGIVSTGLFWIFLPGVEVGTGLMVIQNVPAARDGFATSTLYCICSFLSYIGLFFVMPYIMSSMAAIYEIMNGNLRHVTEMDNDTASKWIRTNDYKDAIPMNSKEYYDKLEQELEAMDAEIEACNTENVVKTESVESAEISEQETTK